jgi:hypothetical protein
MSFLSKRHPKNEIDLVLSSSGVRAPCFVGGIEAILDKGYTIKRIAGTSGGAVVAAGYALGLTVEELKTIVPNIPYHRFRDFSYRNLFSITNPSIYTGKELDKFYKKVYGDATLKDFKIDCRISVVTILEKEKTILDRNSHPDLPVWEAVRMSSTIPFVFPYLYLGEKAVTDGGILTNLFDVFPDKERRIIGLRPRANARLRQLLESSQLRSPSQNRFGKTIREIEEGYLFLWNYIKVVAEFFLDAVDSQHIPQDEWENTIIIPTNEIGSFHFDLNEKDLKELLDVGFKAVFDSDLLPKII